jgi:AcrR family transcriptional regulator
MAGSVAPSAPDRRTRRKQEVRGRILEAATALFDAHGVAATRVVDVCERADVAEKTFFNHFPSRQHLLRAIAEQALDVLLSDLEQARKAPVPTAERLARLFRAIAANARAAGPMHRDLLSEMIHVAHEAGTGSEQARKLRDAFGALVRDGMRRGDVTRRHDPETLTDALLGSFYALMLSYAGLDGYPLRERAEATARFLGAAFAAPRARSGA